MAFTVFFRAIRQTTQDFNHLDMRRIISDDPMVYFSLDERLKLKSTIDIHAFEDICQIRNYSEKSTRFSLRLSNLISDLPVEKKKTNELTTCNHKSRQIPYSFMGRH